MWKGSGLYEVSNIYWKSGFCIDQKKQTAFILIRLILSGNGGKIRIVLH